MLDGRQRMRPPNPARTTSIVWWFITALAIFAIFLPGLIGLEGFDGGFAVSVIAFMLAVTGVIVAIVYMRRASALDKIFDGKGLLAHWTYPREEWIEYAKQERQREKSTKKALFLLIAVIALVTGAGFWLFTRDSAGGWVFVSMLGLILLIGFTAWFTTWYNYRQNMKYTGEAYITPNAIYLNRQLHIWNSLGSWLEAVNVKGDSNPYLEFKYMSPSRTGIQECNVNVPIPRGKEQEAEEILKKVTTGRI